MQLKLTTHHDYKKYIDDIVSGDDLTAVTTTPPMLLAPTSGTTTGEWQHTQPLSRWCG